MIRNALSTILIFFLPAVWMPLAASTEHATEEVEPLKLENDHLTPEDFFEFIDRGGGRGGMGHHLMDCPECLYVLDLVLLAEIPATAEEEAILDAIPEITVEDSAGAASATNSTYVA